MTSSLLLHTCCADCALLALDALKHSDTQYRPTLYFDNSNIHPRTEYLARQMAVQKISRDLRIPLVISDWSPESWFKAIGKTTDNTGLARCKKCWKYRLERTQKKAIELGIPLYSTTLMASHHQDRDAIESIGEALSTDSVKFQPLPQRDPSKVPAGSPHDQTGMGFYRQNYCGCAYSLVERYEEKWGTRYNHRQP